MYHEVGSHVSKKSSNRFGFTLVELLVVISIIAMLAGLLLPAIQAAREAGRRAQCLNNQRQVAFALINHDATKGFFPPLRGPLKKKGDYFKAFEAGVPYPNPVYKESTWVGFILPNIEQSAMWERMDADDNVDPTLYELSIPVMQCPSAGISGSSRISYVVNAGPQNRSYNGTTDTLGIAGIEFGIDTIKSNARVKREYIGPDTQAYTGGGEQTHTLFFDHLAEFGLWSDNPGTGVMCATPMSVDILSSNTMDGTSMTILVSENDYDDAGYWIWCAERPGSTGGTPITHPGNFVLNVPTASDYAIGTWKVYPKVDLSDIEPRVGFCYPNEFVFEPLPSPTVAMSYEVPYYYPSTDDVPSPLFINEGRQQTYTNYERFRKARPSSSHPGIVVTTFCDNSVRPLKEGISPKVFFQLCRPGSGVIINPKDLD